MSYKYDSPVLNVFYMVDGQVYPFAKDKFLLQVWSLHNPKKNLHY
jgi:hypothetical protein